MERIESLILGFSINILIWFSTFTLSYPIYQHVKLPSGAVGPESFAFDCNGDGPYTGVYDGRILKWQATRRSWKEFAVTAASRRSDVCDGSADPILEHTCGRPLGVQFNKVTCELYIGDPYYGLLKVGRNGGVAKQLASNAEGIPFRFINSLDINQKNGLVYLTDSSIIYQRREVDKVVQTGDTTGRLMSYDPRTTHVEVLLRDLKFSNGVVLSKDKKYLLVAETTGFRIVKYWLQGRKAKTTEVFISDLPAAPDNIKRNRRGHFWVGLNNGGRTPSMNDTLAVRLNKRGRIMERLAGDGLMRSVSEVDEHKGILFLGSVSMPYVSLFPVKRH